MFTDKLLRHQMALRAGAALDLPLHTKNTKSLDIVLEEHIATVTKALEKANAVHATTEEKLAGLQGELTELSQKMAQGRRGGGDPVQMETLGARFLREKGADVGALKEVSTGAVAMSAKTVTSGSTSGGGIHDPYRDGVVSVPRRPLMVRSLLPVVRTDKGAIEYPKQTTRDLNAAPVAEGALKPESNLGWTLQTVPVRTIAHWVQASRQILEDVGQLEGLIQTDLIYGLDDKEDTQLLLGDGTGQNLTGLYTNALDYAAPYALTAPNKMDRIGSALLQLALNDFTGTGIVMHPADWLRIKLTKDSTGAYLVSDPITGKVSTNAASVPMLWGVPVIPTKGIGVGKFLVGEFAVAATLYDRWEARVEASVSDRDNFIRNMVTILAEERLALAIKQNGALIRGDFSGDA